MSSPVIMPPQQHGCESDHDARNRTELPGILHYFGASPDIRSSRAKLFLNGVPAQYLDRLTNYAFRWDSRYFCHVRSPPRQRRLLHRFLLRKIARAAGAKTVAPGGRAEIRWRQSPQVIVLFLEKQLSECSSHR
jgi:hypothetical protein